MSEYSGSFDVRFAAVVVGLVGGADEAADFGEEVGFVNVIEAAHLFDAGACLEEIAVVFKGEAHEAAEGGVCVEFPPRKVGNRCGVAVETGHVGRGHIDIGLGEVFDAGAADGGCEEYYEREQKLQFHLLLVLLCKGEIY